MIIKVLIFDFTPVLHNVIIFSAFSSASFIANEFSPTNLTVSVFVRVGTLMCSLML